MISLPMTTILLYATQESLLTDVIVWILMILTMSASVLLIFIQRRKGRDLVNELEQLDKLKKNNVQNEFILKALHIATWHMDVQKQEIAYDFDYRERTGDWIADSSVTDGDLGRGVGMLHEQDAPRVARSIQNLCEGKISEYHEEYRVCVPNTNRVYWEESFATVSERGVDGRATMLVGTSKRIDDRKKMESDLVDARYRAEESDRLKTAFLANMSHEIRTPLNAIVGFTSVLPDVDSAEERKVLLDLIHENTQKLLRIVDDVVTISKIEAGKEDLDISTFNLAMILQEVMRPFASKLKEGVVMNTSFADPELMITTDMNRITETMKHLLSNAAKFTNVGSVTVGFDMPDDDRINIWVRDTGIGISAEHQSQIFESFFKVDEFIPGAGLGLSTCRTMVYSLGGTVTCQSTIGEGSTFTLNIPVKQK